MHAEPISHLEAFFEILFCPNLRIRAMGRLSPHSLYVAPLSSAVSLRLCFAAVYLCVWFRHLKSQLLHFLPFDSRMPLHRFFLHLFCTRRANENGYKTHWRVAGVIHGERAWSCCAPWAQPNSVCLGSVRPVRKPTASRSCSTLAWLRNQKWACDVQDYILVWKAAVKPKTNTGNVNIKAKQRNSSSFKTVRCEKVLVSRVKTSGGKGEIVSLL